MTNAPEGWNQAGRSEHSLTAATVNEWVSIVRRARLGSTTTLVALTVASYADPDGSKVFPGQARVAYECELSLATAKRALRKLREAGLIEVVRRGNRRRGIADEYRLILAEDVLERVEVPSPEQERRAVEVLKDAERGASRDRYERLSRVTGDPRNPSAKGSVKGSVNPQREFSEDSLSGSHTTFTGHPGPVNSLSRVTSVRESRVTRDPPPSSSTLHTSYPPDIPLARDRRRPAARRHEANGKPWAGLQQRYDAGQLDDFHVIEEIEQRIGGFDELEERTAEGMLASGSHVKAIANKILADRRPGSSDSSTPDDQVDFAEWQYGEYDPEAGAYEAGGGVCDCGHPLKTDTDIRTGLCPRHRLLNENGDDHG